MINKSKGIAPYAYAIYEVVWDTEDGGTCITHIKVDVNTDPTTLDCARAIAAPDEAENISCVRLASVTPDLREKLKDLPIWEQAVPVSKGQEIAEWLMATGSSKTFSGNYHIEFSEVNEKFGTNLPADKKLMEEIEKAIDPLVCIDYDDTEDFDMLFGLFFCPLHEEVPEWR